MFIELHIIQSFPPTNLNRDDMNQPKDCEFGGVRRARVSSQCLKRAIRTNPVFAATTRERNSTRTRFIHRALCAALEEADKPKQEAHNIATLFAEAYSGELKGKEDQEKHTAVALYLSPREIEWTVGQLLDRWDAMLAAYTKLQEEKAKKDRKGKKSDTPWAKLADELAKQTKDRTTSAPDIALFGRMLAKRPDTNVDAACQVAHAISTHAIKMDTDFFTAVEELAKPDETGAAMMDIAGFNCACFYRYARLDWEQLTKNLAGDTDLARRTAEAFLRASEAAMPTGKKSSYDNYTRPVFMLAVVRKEHSAGWSLVNAFEKPVRTWGGLGLVEPSVLALDHYWNDLCQFYGKQTVKAVAVALHPTFKPKELSETLQSAIKPGSADESGMDTWVEAILDELQE